MSQQSNSKFPQAGRAQATDVKLAGGFGGKLVFASGITVLSLSGMVLSLILSINFLQDTDRPVLGFGICIGLTLVFNLIMFFLSPPIMDLMQNWLYKTQWMTLQDLAASSPETADVIKRVCQDHNIRNPRLGLIPDQNPTAFTYGSLPNSARLVVSEGLFTYLDEDEVAAVYAHELGHIVHWDFAIMTVAATLVQVIYLLYCFIRSIGRVFGDNDKSGVQAGATSLAMVAYVFYLVGTYLSMYLSRTREYFADQFAAEVTGNPNALSRALVKIAYGIMEEGSRSAEPSKLLAGTRVLGICDHKSASASGTAYRVAADSSQIGEVFLWDMFNPWGWWLELSSTHPLTGKRVRALSNYAEQLGIVQEFNMGKIIGLGKNLSKSRLYGNFFLDICLYSAEMIGLLGGGVIGFILMTASHNPKFAWILPILGLSLGIACKTLVMYPSFKDSKQTDVLSLMSDPYASPLRGKPVQLSGTVIGRGDAGYIAGSDVMLQDKTGLLYIHHASRLGPIGNFLFGLRRVKRLIGAEVAAVGWFRRGTSQWLDSIRLTTTDGTIVNSYHRFWSFVCSGGLLLFAIMLWKILPA
jgi:Zn-dependent protease with chaperone function